MGHETYSRESDKVQLGSDRSFGFLFAVVFSAVGIWLWFEASRYWPFAALLATVFAALALLIPSVLRPLNRSWMMFGAFMHRVVSPIILGVMFFGAVVPIGLIMRMRGKDLLNLKWDSEVHSYWIQRDEPGPAPQSLNDQF